jgi:hypothetical protein
MSTTPPLSVVEAFGAGGTPGVDYTVIPVPDQTGVSPELASFTTGFPVATRTARTLGGIPPRGKDMNGILFMVSGHTAWLAAGNTYAFNADVVTVAGGYAVGAVVRSAADLSQYFYNTLANNTNDPDSVITGWVKFSPLAASANGLSTVAPAAGTFNNVAVAAGIRYLDVNTALGDVSYTGWSAAYDGQIVVVSNTGANLLNLRALNGGSLAGNQFRIPSDFTIVQNQSVTFQKSVAIGKWIAI